jgi:hypothetical protein
VLLASVVPTTPVIVTCPVSGALKTVSIKVTNTVALPVLTPLMLELNGNPVVTVCMLPGTVVLPVLSKVQR